MAPPPSYSVSPTLCLVVRILTVVCLIISLIILVTATGNAYISTYTYIKVNFKDFKAFRYLCASTVIGLVYSAVQAALTAYRVITSNRLGGDTLIHFDFYADKVVSYLLATGGAASFGMTQDVEELTDYMGIASFINTTNAAAALCLLGCLFTIVSSVFSSFSLPKKP